MPDPDRELMIARSVSSFSERYRDKKLGEPLLNDDGQLDGLFDVRFDAADPPVALEITSIVDPPFIATARIADPVAEALTMTAKEESLGRWYVEIVAGTRLKSIGPAILNVIKTQAPLPQGVQTVQKAKDGEHGVVICTWSSDTQEVLQPLPGFTSELERALRKKQAKLGRAEGYERHLAVELRALRAQDPSQTPVPTLPPTIDVLWVVNTIAVGGEPVGWWTTGQEWTLSHERPPTGGIDPFSCSEEDIERHFAEALRAAIGSGLSLDVVAQAVGMSRDQIVRLVEDFGG